LMDMGYMVATKKKFRNKFFLFINQYFKINLLVDKERKCMDN
jgi:hypothetical protein